MAMRRRRVRAVCWAAVVALGAGLVSPAASAQQLRSTVTAYGFELSCDASASEGSTLACTLSNTSDEAADWPTVAIVHLSSDDDRALVVGSPVDVAFGDLEGGPVTEDDVWWIGDVLVGYSRFDWDGEATASSESETADSRTVNIVVADDTAWEEAESFYVALAPSGARGVGFLYDSRQRITIGRSDSKSSDATLASLVISAGGTTTELSPPPSLHPLEVDYTTTALTVAPTATYRPSGISVAVAGGAGYSFAVESGEETRATPLAVGLNTISVTVTAENGTSSQTYEVAVNRASLVDGATVTVSSDGFSLTCPGTVAEGSTTECTLTNLSTSPADWPVVAFLHSSADASRALIAEDPIIPELSLLYSQDIRLTDPQVPVVDNYNYGYGELFSGGSRSVYATYGYEKFDWLGTADALASRTVFVEVLADDRNEGAEVFYAAIAGSGYTGLSGLVDNKVPIVVRGTSSAVSIEVFGKNEAAEVLWTGLDAIDGEPVTNYDLRSIRNDATDRSDANWEVRTPIWRPGDGTLAFVLTDLVNDVSYDIQVRAAAGTTTGPWSSTETVTPTLENNAPAFPDTETGQRDVAEGAIARRSVGAPISATDPDGDWLLYSLQSGGDVFDISAGTGQLLTKSDLDYETASTHSVVVAVSDGKDGGGGFDASVDATVDVTVLVIDVNEAPALSGPSAADFTERGDAPVATYAADDPEGGDVSWSLGGADAASFEISATGVLRFLTPPDFNTPGDADRDNAYEVQVQITDGNDAAHQSDTAVDATVDVTVSVIDANEAPALSGPSAVEFVERDDAPVATYTADDPEGGDVSWSLGGADAASLEISATGVLRFLTPPEVNTRGDADRDNAYEVQVQITDGRDAAYQPDTTVDATVEVTVTVIDANGAPALSGPSAVDFVERGDAPVATYTADDPEGDDVSWSLGGADAASFEISAAGVLRFLTPPEIDTPGDADRDNAYEVQVQVTGSKDALHQSNTAVDATIDLTVSVEPPGGIDELDLRSDAPGEIAVSWDAVSPPPTGYQVEWRPANEPWGFHDPARSANSSSTSYLLTGLDPELVYKVRVFTNYQSATGNTPRRFVGVRRVGFAKPTGQGAPDAVPEGTALAGVVSVDSLDLFGTPGVGYGSGGNGRDQFDAHYWDSNLFVSQTQLAGLAHLEGTTSFAGGIFDGEMSLQSPVLLAVIPTLGTSAAYTPFILEVDGRVLASTQAEVPEGQTTPTDRQYWLWENPCVDWQAGDMLDMSIVAVDASDPRLLAQTNATLGSLRVVGIRINEDFDPAITQYTLVVASGVNRITIAAEAADSNACGLAITPDDADETADGHQIDLTDDVAIEITVTAGDGQTNLEYVLNVSHAQSPFERRSDLDLTGIGNISPRGLWSDGTTLWTVSANEWKLLALDIATGERQRAKEFPLATGPGPDDYNVTPSGIWSDGSTMWVADYSGRVFAYELATGQRQTTREFDDVLDGETGHGALDIWSDGSTMWVSRFPAAGLLAYSMETRARQPQFDMSAEMMRAEGNSLPSGLGAVGTTIWVGDTGEAKVYAYHLRTGERQPELDFSDPDPTDSASPDYLWSDGSTMWLVDDNRPDRIFVYRAT